MRLRSCWRRSRERRNEFASIYCKRRWIDRLVVDRYSSFMSANIKNEARRLIEALPDDSTWEDLMYQIYVRETIEAGLADSEAGRVTDVEKVREEFGLPA
jgi:hypothetical protein